MVCSLSCLSSHSPLAIYPDHFQEPSIVIDLCNEEGDVSESDSVSIISSDSESGIEILEIAEVEVVAERHSHKRRRREVDLVAAREGERLLQGWSRTGEDELEESAELDSDKEGEEVDSVEWLGKGVEKKGRIFFPGALLRGKLQVIQGDTVLLSPPDDSPLYVGTVVNLFEGSEGPSVHILWFCRDIDTILGPAKSIGDKIDGRGGDQLFQTDYCEDQPLLSIVKKCQVTFKPEPAQLKWRRCGDHDQSEEKGGEDQFWWRLHVVRQTSKFDYRHAPPPATEGENPTTWCGTCALLSAKKQEEAPVLGEPTKKGQNTFKSLKWRGNVLKPGDGLFLTASSVNFNIGQQEIQEISISRLPEDNEIYTERHRKRPVKSSKSSSPFQVVQIKEITKEKGKVMLKVRLFYRPEDTHLGTRAAEKAFYNEIYYSDDEACVPFEAVRGKCCLRYFEKDTNPNVLENWRENGPHRFFFQERYNLEEKKFEEAPTHSKLIGHVGVGDAGANYPEVQRLACLDIFSGCGGFSLGLQQAAVAEVKWAVEINQPAAEAFKVNHTGATVFKEDCTEILRKIKAGEKSDQYGQALPKKGEVDLLCCGPPCQGFSSANRFKDSKKSQLKNALVSTCLSYCKHFKPRFFVLENVLNFATHKKGFVLRRCMRTLTNLGYQATVGVLQAGQYGLPQTRRRVFLIAAAPGEKLPDFPEPQHVFAPQVFLVCVKIACQSCTFQACNLSFKIGGKRFTTPTMWKKEAPYRATTVRDAISDLPK